MNPVPIRDQDVESFVALGVEVEFTHPEHGTFFLVSEYTEADRNEISAADLRKMDMVQEGFPGSSPTKWMFDRTKYDEDNEDDEEYDDVYGDDSE